MLEFTLVNHPVDCPICDKAGECTLQKMYQEWDGSPLAHRHRQGAQAQGGRPRPADRARRRALHPVHALHPRLRRGGQGSPARDGLPRRSRAAHGRAGQAARQSLLAQHRRRLPGRRAHARRTSASPCAPGSSTPRRRCAPAAPPAATSRCTTRAARSIASCRARTRPSTSSGCATRGASPTRRSTAQRVAGAAHRRRAGVAGQGASPSPPSGSPALPSAALARRRAQRAGDQRGQLRSWPRSPRRSASTHVYLAGRPPRPERADDILRSADVNPNTAGARAIAAWGGAKAKGTQQLNADIVSGSAARPVDPRRSRGARRARRSPRSAKLDVVYQSPHDNFLSDKVLGAAAGGGVGRGATAPSPTPRAWCSACARRRAAGRGAPASRAHRAHRQAARRRRRLRRRAQGAVHRDEGARCPSFANAELRPRGAADPASLRRLREARRMGLILLFLDSRGRVRRHRRVALVGICGWALPWVGVASVGRVGAWIRGSRRSSSWCC